MHCFTGNVTTLTEQLATLEESSAELSRNLAELQQEHSQVQNIPLPSHLLTSMCQATSSQPALEAVTSSVGSVQHMSCP